MFLDALPQAGSPGAVALMADLIKVNYSNEFAVFSIN